MPDDKMEIIRGCMISYDCGDRVTKCETCGWNVREAERRKAQKVRGKKSGGKVKGKTC